MNDYLLCHSVLEQVYRQGAYSNAALGQALDQAENKAWLTRMVYGVLSHEIECDYYIDALCTRKPRPAIRTLLQMGIYQLRHMDGVPTYAAVHSCVQACAQMGKPALKGFVNAVLQSYLRKIPALPQDPVQALSVTASVPLWLARRLVKEYGLELATQFLTAPICTDEHVRHNSRLCTAQEMERMLSEKQSVRPSSQGGWYVQNTPYVRQLFDQGMLTVQSETSLQCCRVLDPKPNERILDACAAPGGKAVYCSEHALSVTACELHPHRVQLIRAYAHRMEAGNLQAECRDMTQFNAEWKGQFDAVLCDVPCSGIGVRNKKPELLRTLRPEDIESLHQVQSAILETCAQYVKDGGRLVYATCTILRRENAQVVQAFLSRHAEWKCTYSEQILPDGSGRDGFFIARLEKTV